MDGHDQWPRVRNFATRAEYAPAVGQRLTGHHVHGSTDHGFSADFGRDRWEVTEVVPIEDRPGWVRVYVELVESGPPAWEGVAPPPR